MNDKVVTLKFEVEISPNRYKVDQITAEMLEAIANSVTHSSVAQDFINASVEQAVEELFDIQRKTNEDGESLFKVTLTLEQYPSRAKLTEIVYVWASDPATAQSNAYQHWKKVSPKIIVQSTKLLKSDAEWKE